ncbi:MAG: type II toxin-antitoxin system HigB family toxin [Spirochaetales bacterium]|nr:type II toxin-antitoxin system HigB family toxin [Spirochaetales bacterium]
MNVITLKHLKAAYLKHPVAEERLLNWHKHMKENTFLTLEALRKIEPTADPVTGTDYMCFDINGKSFRLIVRITWGKTVFVKEFLTHGEYTKKYVKSRGKKAGRKK